MWEKFSDFLNNSDNELVIRLMMVFLGAILGTAFIFLSVLIKNHAASVSFLVFGCVTYGSFLLSAGIWYLVEN